MVVLPAQRNTVLISKHSELDFLYLFLQHLRVLAQPFTSIIGGSRASSSSLLSLVRPNLGNEVCRLPTCPAGTPKPVSSALLLLGLGSPCWGPPRRRPDRNLGGVELVVELGRPSSASCRLVVFEVDGAFQVVEETFADP